MASIDEVLNTMSDTDYLHDHIQFLIDEDLRTITIPSNGVVLGVVGDQYVNRVNFQMPRYYNGFDMSEFTTTVMYMNANSTAGFYLVDDITIDGDTLYFTWLVDPWATSHIGDVVFSVKMTKYVDGQNDKIFNTTINKATVLEGMNVKNVISEEVQKDFLSKLSIILNSVKASHDDVKNMYQDIFEKYSLTMKAFNECVSIKYESINNRDRTKEYLNETRGLTEEARSSSSTSTEMANKANEYLTEMANKANKYLTETKQLSDQINNQIDSFMNLITEYPVNNYIVDENNQILTFEQDGTSYSLEEQIIYLVLGKRPTT